MINTLPGFTHSAASECVRTAPILSKARGSFKTRSPSLLPFVKYCCAGDSFLIYLVNSWRVKKKEFYIMEMMEWVIISHIFITADIGPCDTVLHLAIVPFLFSHTVPLNGQSRL